MSGTVTEKPEDSNFITDQITAGYKAAAGRVAEFAEANAIRVKDDFDRLTVDAEKATDYLEKAYTKAIADVASVNRKLLEFAKGDAAATFASVREVFASKSVSEALSHHAAFLRDRFEAISALANEAFTFGQKAAEETWEPAVKAAVAAIGQTA
jgi:hypothetical protein